MIPVAADAEQALAMIRSHPDGTVVDVRDEEEYITGHLATPCCCRSTRSAPRRLQRPCPIRVARSSSTARPVSAAALQPKSSQRSDTPSSTTLAALAVGHTVSNKQIHKTEPIPFPGTGSM